MRGFGFMSFGAPRRNEPVELVDPRPLPRYTMEDMETGDAAKDGYTRISTGQAQPSGVVGPVFRGPDMSWEQ